MFEADITACFDEINHQALLDRMRRRISDKKVLGLVKAFLKAGVLTEDGYCSQKAERSLCQRRASGEHGLAEGDDQEKSTPLDHVVCVKATWLEPLN